MLSLVQRYGAAGALVAILVPSSSATSTYRVASDVPGAVVRSDEHGRRALAIVEGQADPAAPIAALVAANWQALGPFGGDIEAVEVSPVDPNLVLAAFAPSSGAGGGLFRSTDGGANWALVPTLTGKSCYDVAFAPDGAAYVGTIDGVWKSTNAGASFVAQNLGIGLNDQVLDVTVDPSDAQRVWCGIADAAGFQPVNVMMSVNGGASWTNKTPPLGSPMGCSSIAIDPANSNNVYAGFRGAFGGGQFWVSNNGGTSWVNRSAGLPTTPINDVVHDGARVLVAGGQLFGSQNFGLFVTVNDGVVWTPLHDGTWPSLVIQDIAIDPNAANVILVGTAGKGVFRSVNGGLNWAFQIGGTGALSVNSVAFAPGSSTTVFTGSSSNAVWRSTDAAASFQASSAGIGALAVYSIGSNPLDGDELAIAFQGLNDGGVYTTLDHGQSWSLAALPPTRYSVVRFAPTGELYAISGGPSSIAPEGLYRRTGATWSSIGPNQGTLFESDLFAMRFSANDPNLIWAAGGDFGVAGAEPTVWRTTNGGGLWTKVYEGVNPNETIRDLHVVDAATDTTLVAAYTDFGSAPQVGGVLRSTDGGVVWNPSSTGLTATPQCTSLAASPTDANTLYVSNNVFSGQPAVFESTDAGQTWASTGFVGQAVRVATDLVDPNVLYIAQNGATKVQASTDGGASFSPYDAGLVNVGVVRDLQRSLGVGSDLLLGTGTGSYATDIQGSFESYCAGDGSLGPCPCGNTGAPGRGCDNSASTGGAKLAASGTVNPDSVVLTSSGELPSALSIFLQGNVDLAPSAVPFGDGLRCVGGSLKRLYVKNASGGAVSAPGVGDQPITLQSLALGDPISPGSTRFYQTYYRDPNLGFCPTPTGNTWNVSSALRITW